MEKEKKKTPKIPKVIRKRRISLKGRRPPLPTIVKMQVKDVFVFIKDKHDSEKYEDIEKSLDKYGYNPKKFDFIAIKEIVNLGFKVTNGRKRIKILNRKNPEQKIQVLHQKPFYTRKKMNG